MKAIPAFIIGFYVFFGCQGRVGGPDLDVEKKLEKSVVQIRVGNSWGSGFAVKVGKETLVATAFHVVMRTGPIMIMRTITEKDKKYKIAFVEATVEAVDARHDVALLSISSAPPDALVPLSIAEVPATQGSLVRVAGFPSTSLTASREMGFVLKPPSSIPAGAVVNVVQADAIDPETGKVFEKNGTKMHVVNVGIEPGNSGGPLLNEDGQVVGIVVLKDMVHQLQDGAIDVQYLKALMGNVEKNELQYDKVTEDLESAKKSLSEALKGPLSLAVLTSSPVGDFLLNEERGTLKEILRVLLSAYISLPENADPDSFPNLFKLLWDGGGKGYSRSRMKSFNDIIQKCSGGLTTLPEGTTAFPGIISDLMLDCAADELLPDFAMDTVEALLLGGEVEDVLGLTIKDRNQKRFQAKVKMAATASGGEKKVIPLDLLFKRGGWRIALTSDVNSQLSGRYEVPADYLASAYKSTCNPKETSSDCVLTDVGKGRLLDHLFTWQFSMVNFTHGMILILEDQKEYSSPDQTTPLFWWSRVGLGVVKEASLDFIVIGQKCSSASFINTKAGNVYMYDMDQSGNISGGISWGTFKFHRQ